MRECQSFLQIDITVLNLLDGLIDLITPGCMWMISIIIIIIGYIQQVRNFIDGPDNKFVYLQTSTSANDNW